MKLILGKKNSILELFSREERKLMGNVLIAFGDVTDDGPLV